MFPSKGNWLIYFKTKWKALLRKFHVHVLNALLTLGCTKQNFIFIFISLSMHSVCHFCQRNDWWTELLFSFSGLQLNAFHDAKTEMTHDTAFHICLCFKTVHYVFQDLTTTYLAWKLHNHFSFIVGYLIYPLFSQQHVFEI